jgi:ferrous-iron efflux pump FieF
MDSLDELKGLRRISEVSVCTSLIIIPLSIIISMITGSVTLLVYFIWAVAALAVKIFALISSRIMLKENQYMFPYGTGKLENFSSFFFGVSIVPFGCYFLIVSITNLFSPLTSVTYPLCMIPVALSFLMTMILIIWTTRIITRHPNHIPILKAYIVNFKISLTSDSFLFIAFLAGFILSVTQLDFLSILVDPILSTILSLYMLKEGLPLIIDNFRSLIDLPLSEKDMLKILKVVAEFYDEYSGLGLLYSRQSGKQKIIEIELIFDPGISLEKIAEIEGHMASRINEAIPNVQFRLIPKARI